MGFIKRALAHVILLITLIVIMPLLIISGVVFSIVAAIIWAINGLIKKN